MMNFAQAMAELCKENKVTRKLWDGDVYVHRVEGEKGYELHVRFSSGQEVAWTPTNNDLFADDWQLQGAVEEPPKELTFNCPRSFIVAPAQFEHWWEVARGHRTCSFCGSLHPEDFMEAVRSLRGELVPTDKTDKVYLCSQEHHQAKFYFQHLPPELQEEFVALVNTNNMRIAAPGHFYMLPFFMQYDGEPSSLPLA